MKRLFKRTFFFSLTVAVLFAVCASAGAQTSRERSTKKARAAADQSAKAARVFEQIMGAGIFRPRRREHRLADWRLLNRLHSAFYE